MSAHTTPPTHSDPEYVSVRLVGGPACLAGTTLEGVYAAQDLAQPLEDLGAMLVVPDGRDLPERDGNEDTNPRACYGPLPPPGGYSGYVTPDGLDPAVWHFTGFIPSGPHDPSPAWYQREDLVRTAAAAEGVLNGRDDDAFAGAAAAQAWLDEHHGEVVEAIGQAYRHDDPAQSLRLAQALDTRLPHGPHADQVVEVAHLGLTAARALGEDTAVYDRLLVLSTAHRRRGEHDQAVEHGREAVRVAARVGGEHAVRAAYHLGAALAWAGEHEEALVQYGVVLAEHDGTGSALEVAATNGRAWSLSQAGRVEEALSPARRAVELAERLGEDNALAAACDTLGEVHAARGERPEALAAYRRALEIYQEMGYELRIDQVRESIRVLEARSQE
ncbi:tetratricopeptide repeat protein [Nocardiopsis synnemataformans]|uniref:tetratricopeptide repeat protein n=1 Tax=Nocardiopsis synnemataformans TaxID=61305 RepID=UPI003EBF4C29